MLKNIKAKLASRLHYSFQHFIFNSKKLNGKPLTWLGWLVCLLSLIFTPTGLWLEKLNAAYLEQLQISTHPVQAVMAVTFPLVGALIITFKPTQPVGWLLAASGFLMAVAWVSRQYALYSLVTSPGALPASTYIGWFYLWSWMTSLVLFPLAILLFPTGKLPSSRWSFLGWLNLVAWGLIVLPVAVFSWQIRGIKLLNIKPNELLGSAIVLTLLGVILMVVVALGTIVSLVVRLKRAGGDEKLQLKWFTYAVALVITTGAVNGIADVTQDALFLGITSAITYVTYAAVPASVAVAILKYHLFDIDFVINRTLVYGSLTAGLAFLYVAITSLLGIFLHAQGNLVVAFFATVLIASLFQPLYQRIQRAVNRLMYGERDEPYRVLSRLAQRLEATLAPEKVLPTIVETVAHALKLPFVAIVLPAQESASGYIAASYGTMPNLQPGQSHEQEQGYAQEKEQGQGQTQSEMKPQTTELDLTYQQEKVGKLVLAPRAPGEAFNPADRHLLADLVRQIGVAVHAVHLTTNLKESAQALQQARERLVNTREEERRRLRRNLHDGLGPALATLSLKAEAACDLIWLEPTESHRLLVEIAAQAQSSIADIRRLVYDMRPPALDDLGLSGAIRAQLAGFEQARTTFIFNAPEPLPPLPAAVEVAVYRIIQESLTNVIRHAGATHCRVNLEIETGGELEIVVQDNGRGLPEQVRSGVGLHSMRERAEELGGSCSVATSPDGGTVVRVRLPLPSRVVQPQLQTQVVSELVPAAGPLPAEFVGEGIEQTTGTKK